MIDAMRMRGCSDYTLKEIRWSVYLPIIRYRCDTGTGVCSDEHWKKYAEEYPRKTAYKRGVNLLYFSCHTADKRVRERYGTALQKNVKQNVSDAVYQQFLDAIMNGTWKPEERIPSETELATDLGVSRVTIRGALQRLEGLKLIERRQGEGTFVHEMAGEQYADSLLPVAARTVAMKWG